MASKGGSVSKAERLRDLAQQAENLAGLAGLADAQLTRASADLQTLAAAARTLSERLNRDADSAEVTP